MGPRGNLTQSACNPVLLPYHFATALALSELEIDSNRQGSTGPIGQIIGAARNIFVEDELASKCVLFGSGRDDTTEAGREESAKFYGDDGLFENIFHPVGFIAISGEHIESGVMECEPDLDSMGATGDTACSCKIAKVLLGQVREFRKHERFSFSL
jgi:hypothetical protein